ncbi:MAG: hypothetical protein PHH96_02215 [Smithellaceae bacterium]|jgi:hypothetical protein|nr:hypothetical protein [Smithellaceae bacterium]MDD5413616.1 hypothetical protein [Smithellaceae bacterium]
MANPLTTAQEYEAVRGAIQAFATGESVYSFSLGDMSITYHSAQAAWLQDREKELAKRLSQRNVRKRTVPDFS